MGIELRYETRVESGNASEMRLKCLAADLTILLDKRQATSQYCDEFEFCAN
jgi:hypothetical protein